MESNSIGTIRKCISGKKRETVISHLNSNGLHTRRISRCIETGIFIKQKKSVLK